MKYTSVTTVADMRQYRGKDIHAYYTDDGHILEGPTLWLLSVAERTHSPQTVRVYGQRLARYLRWYDFIYGLTVGPDDEMRQRREDWQLADIAILRAYREHLLDIQDDDEHRRPSNESINAATTTIVQFYDWATQEEYTHFVSVKRTERRMRIESGTSAQPIYRSVYHHELLLPKDRYHLLKNELTRFIDNESLKLACKLLNERDPVYRFIAMVLRFVPLRPGIDLPQLPFHGEGPNRGMRWYSNDEIARDGLENESISFTFLSKGHKRHTLAFPGDLWAILCRHWMPLRQERARRYADAHNGRPPGNDILFLTEAGVPVTYPMLYEAFAKVTDHPRWIKERTDETTGEVIRRRRYETFTPYMLRRAWATYHVLNFAKKQGTLPNVHDMNLVLANELKYWLGHEDVKTAYEHYVQLCALLMEPLAERPTGPEDSNILQQLARLPLSP